MSVEAKHQLVQPKVVLNPTAQAVTFSAGLYLFTVRVATPEAVSDAGGMLLPALLVSVAPGQPAGSAEFVGAPGSASTWLYNVGDSIVVKVGGEAGTLLLNSIRVAGDTRSFDIQVDRLDAQQVASSPPAPPPTVPSLKLRVGLHLLRQGDVEVVGAEWAGRAGSGAWIEAFSIQPLETLKATDIEYKGLAANGFETPWLSDGASCGTKGVNIPLVGFAIRLKAQAALNYDCEYSAMFRSGAVVGPFRNGVPCRSKVVNDPLDAVQIRIVKRDKPASAMSSETKSAVQAVAQRKGVKGPSFGKFREEAPVASKPVAKKAAAKTVAKAPAKTPVKKAAVGSKSAASKTPAKPKPKKTSGKRK